MDSHELKTIRKDIARFMRRLYDRGLTTASGGNISVTTGQGILITPSALDKGLMKARQIAIISMEGQNFTPELKPSMETAMHLAIYKKRPDIKAIVHAHPPIATCFTAMHKEINCCLIAEARAVLGNPVRAPYALMGTKDLADSVANAAVSGKDHQYPNIILLDNHGIVCLGNDLLSAFDRMEVLEAAARMTMISALMGAPKPLTDEQLKAIDLMMTSPPAPSPEVEG
jgi:L-fuculose-phosphate aldolase